MSSANEKSIHGPSARRSGSAMILVVVLTVLLSMIGLMFILASRIEQATSLSANVDRDLSAGVDSVVDRINKVLVDDLFRADRKAGLCDGTKDTVNLIVYNEPFDAVGKDDSWLMSINPGWQEDPPALPEDLRDDKCDWFDLSDLYFDVWGISASNILGLGLKRPAMTVGPNLYYPSNDPLVGTPQIFPPSTMPRADADGDGVWDSIWVKLPNISSAKGVPIYTAVRIIDNCAMLNLNTAFKLEATSEGQYLSAVDYERFRRGGDRDNAVPANDIPLADRIRKARMVSSTATLDTVQQYHDRVIMNIDNPDPTRYRLFDLADELEIRNRLLLTTAFKARFERPDVAYYTFDVGGGVYKVMSVPRTDSNEDTFPYNGTSYTRTEFDVWKIRMNPANFDDKSGAYFDPTEVQNQGDENKRKFDFRWRYDRRHVCTFYSFDRNIRSGQDWVLDPVVKALRTDYEQEVDLTKKADKLIVLNTVRSVFWAPNGSVASTRDLAIANTPESRKAILQMLYALRAYYLQYGSGLTEAEIRADLADSKHPKQLLSKAARKAAQTVANMIDYLDDSNAATPGPFIGANYGTQSNADPTFIDEALVQRLVFDAYKAIDTQNPFDPTDAKYAFGLGNHVVYGYERQPFISELYCQFTTRIDRFAVELVNPYDRDIPLNGWRIVIRNAKTKVVSRTIPFTAADGVVPKATVPSAGQSWTPDLMGRRVICNADWGILNAIIKPQLAGLPPNDFSNNDQILLQRPIPGGTFLTIDQTEPDQVIKLITSVPSNDHNLKRDDKSWKFANSKEMLLDNGGETLGRANSVNISSAKGYQMPVADNNTATVSKPLATLGDFEKILSIGSEWIAADDPNAVTHFMGLALNEGDVRTDIVSAPKILGYVGFLNRPAGNLPGRININAATQEVIRAAIPPSSSFVKTGEDPQQFANDLAGAIVRTGRAYVFTSIADLVTPNSNISNIISRMTKWKTDTADNVGDPSMGDDIEERDWILSRLSNIFTVRSDTFTAYIAVRIGAPRVVADTDPTKRVVDVDADRRYIAIFDRSAVDQRDESPRIVALHPVPDAR